MRKPPDPTATFLLKAILERAGTNVEELCYIGHEGANAYWGAELSFVDSVKPEPCLIDVSALGVNVYSQEYIESFEDGKDFSNRNHISTKHISIGTQLRLGPWNTWISLRAGI